MPKRIVMIEWDQPNDEAWLADDNIALALHAHCTNTRFTISGAEELFRAAEEILQWRARITLASLPYKRELEGFLHALQHLSTAVHKIRQGRLSESPNSEN